MTLDQKNNQKINPVSCPFQRSKNIFTPPYPVPHKNKNSLFKRFFRGQISWLHTLFEKSYTMKMGEVKLPKLDFFIVNETKLVKKIMIDDVAIFPKHHLLEQLLEPLIGRSIFAVSGKEWEKQRKMVYPAFTHANLRRSFGVMQDATNDLITQMNQQIKTDQPLYIDPLMTFVTADIIYRTLFSIKITQAEADKIYHAFDAFQSAVQPCALLKIYGLPTWYHKRKINKATAKIHAVFAPIIEQRYAKYHTHNQAGDDILGALLQATDTQTQQNFTIEELIDQVSTVFLAGHETSASTLTWALYLLAETPDIQASCRAQIPNNALHYTDLKDLTHLKNTFDETLRLYPPVAFFLREAGCPMKLRQKNIPKGAMVAISPWLIHRNPNEWDNPHAFNPQRFNDANTQAAQKEAYLPFGKGPRTCIGAAFAKQESLIILAKILKNFTLTYTEQQKPEPVSRVTLRPKDGIYLTVKTL
ncbi:MAG: cytochrome P450 [Dasania sp.]|jgi:cytochrome P450